MGFVLNSIQQKERSPWIFILFTIAIMVIVFCLLILAAKTSRQEEWNWIGYKKDTRTGICLAIWERSAVVVPCEKIPDNLFERSK